MECEVNRTKLLASCSAVSNAPFTDLSPPLLRHLWCGSFPHFNLSPSNEEQDKEFGKNFFNSQEYAALRSQIRSHLKETSGINQANRPTTQEIKELYLLLKTYLSYPLALVRHHTSRRGSKIERGLGPSYTPLFNSIGSVDMSQELQLLRGAQLELYQLQLETSLTLVAMAQCILVQAELSSCSKDAAMIAKVHWFHARAILLAIQFFAKECIESTAGVASLKGLKFIRQFAQVLERKCLIHYLYKELQCISTSMEQIECIESPVPMAKRIRQASAIIRAAYTLSTDAIQYTKDLPECETTRQLVWLCQGYQVYLKSVYFWYEQVIYSSDCQEEIALKYCNAILHETRKMPKVPEYSHRHHGYFSQVAFQIQKAHGIVLNNAASVKLKLLSVQKQLHQDKHPPSTLRLRPSSAGSTRSGSSSNATTTGSNNNSNTKFSIMDELLYTIPPLEFPWDKFQQEMSQQIKEQDSNSIMTEYFGGLPPTTQLERLLQESEEKNLTQSSSSPNKQDENKLNLVASFAPTNIKSPRTIELDPLPYCFSSKDTSTTCKQDDRGHKQCQDTGKTLVVIDDSCTAIKGPVFGERPPLTKVQEIAARVRARYPTALTVGSIKSLPISTTFSSTRNIAPLVTSRPNNWKGRSEYLANTATTNNNNEEEKEEKKEKKEEELEEVPDNIGNDNDAWDEEENEEEKDDQKPILQKTNQRKIKIQKKKKKKTPAITAKPMDITDTSVSMSVNTLSWKPHRIACGLCEKRFLQINLPGVVLMKRIFEKRKSWGMVLQQEAKKFSVASTLYAKANVCLMCKEMLSSEEDQKQPPVALDTTTTTTTTATLKRPCSAPTSSSSTTTSNCPPPLISMVQTDFDATEDKIGALILNSILQAWAQNHCNSFSSIEDQIVDISFNKRARQSSTLTGYMAGNALWLKEKKHFAHTKEEMHPWWEVDLANYYVIHSIKVWIREEANPLLLSTFTKTNRPVVCRVDKNQQKNETQHYSTNTNTSTKTKTKTTTTTTTKTATTTTTTIGINTGTNVSNVNTTGSSSRSSSSISSSNTNTYPISLCLLMRSGIGYEFEDIVPSSVSSLRVTSPPSSLTPIVWYLPPNSRGRFVRVQSEKNTKTFLHIEKVQVFIMKDSITSFSANQIIVDGVSTNGNCHRQHSSEVTQVVQPQKITRAHFQSVARSISMVRHSFLKLSSPNSGVDGNDSNVASITEDDEEKKELAEWQALCLENSTTSDSAELVEKRKSSRLYAKFRQLLEERSKYEQTLCQEIMTPHTSTIQSTTNSSTSSSTSTKVSVVTKSIKKNFADLPIRKNNNSTIINTSHENLGHTIRRSSSLNAAAMYWFV